jgi:S-adenosylmethionine/arginine decarboxylase-like enzyme
VNAIEMKAYGPPQIVKFGDGQTRGYTLVQLIETSNITAHFSEDTNNIFLDVFSCKDFDPEIAIDVFCEFFDPTKIKTKVFTRG